MEEGGDEHPSTEETKKKPNAKFTWLLTYGAGGPSITEQLLKECTQLDIDECYTASDHANKHTLIHLTKKVRQTGIQKAMNALSSKTGIVLSNVFGYENINSNSTEDPKAIKAHVLYRWIVREFEARSPTFEFWVSPHKKGKGLFGDLMESPRGENVVNLMKWTKRKLARTVFANSWQMETLRQANASLSNELYELKQKHTLLSLEASSIQK